LKRQMDELAELKEVLNNNQNLKKSVEELITQNSRLQKQIEEFERKAAAGIKQELKNKIQIINGVNVIAEVIQLDSTQAVRDILFQLKSEINDLFLVLGSVIGGKPSIWLIISDHLIAKTGRNAGTVVRESDKEMKGGGGGLAFFASSGRKKPA